MPTTIDEKSLSKRVAALLANPSPALAEALAAEGDERALPVLVTVANDAMEGEEALRYREALRTLATPALLGRWLESAEVDARRVAAHGLSARIVEHVPLIARALADSDAQVRAIGRRTLRSWRASPALHDLFVTLLGHADPRVRLSAAVGLGKIGGHADLDALRSALDREADPQARDRLAWALQVLENRA